MQWPPRPNDGAAALDRERFRNSSRSPAAGVDACRAFESLGFDVRLAVRPLLVSSSASRAKARRGGEGCRGTAWPFHVERRSAVVGPRRCCPRGVLLWHVASGPTAQGTAEKGSRDALLCVPTQGHTRERPLRGLSRSARDLERPGRTPHSRCRRSCYSCLRLERSRCRISARPYCPSKCAASLSARYTDRCCPPVQPIATVR